MATPDKNPGQTRNDGAAASNGGDAKTPGTDMQADDAGTADSGATGGKANAAQGAMKQTSKTDSEREGR